MMVQKMYLITFCSIKEEIQKCTITYIVVNVAFVGCTLQRKVTNRPDKMEQHLYTLLTVCHRKSTPVCGSRMRIRCTVQCRIVTRDFAPDRAGTGLPGCG